MNILKHMEAVFVTAAVLTIGGSYALDTLPQANAKARVAAHLDNVAPVVVIKAKRMSAEEKRQSLQAERRADEKLADVDAVASRL
jgi:hypothetical protein